MLTGILTSDCRYLKSHPLFLYSLERCLAIPTSPFFHLATSKWFFCYLVSVLFSRTPYLPFLVGGNGGQGEIKMASASTPSANEQAKDVVLVHISGGSRIYKRGGGGHKILDLLSLLPHIYKINKTTRWEVVKNSASPKRPFF